MLRAAFTATERRALWRGQIPGPSMGKKRAGGPGGKALAAQAGPKRPRARRFSPFDPEYIEHQRSTWCAL
eukprot:COSAG05_NODE_3296_length_2170_cov_2.142443_2_plen_69_part_01